MSDLAPNPGATAPTKTTAEQKLEQIAAVVAKAPATAAAAQGAKTAETKPEEASTAGANADGTSPDAKADASKVTQIERDPIVELLARLQSASVVLPPRDAGLARGINQLAEQAATPGVTEQAMFRTHVAYSLQDMEKVVGQGRIDVPQELRAEMTRLAATSPGLTNKPMEALLRSTPEIEDRGLVRDLRRAAASLATMGPDQNAPAVSQKHRSLREQGAAGASNCQRRGRTDTACNDTAGQPAGGDVRSDPEPGRSGRGAHRSFTEGWRPAASSSRCSRSARSPGGSRPSPQIEA